MFLHVQNPGKMMIMYLNWIGQGLPRARRAGIVSTITAQVRRAVLCRASTTPAQQRKNMSITNLQSVYYVQSEEDKNGTKNKSIHQDFCNQIGPKKPLQNVVKVVSDRSRK